MEVRRFEWRRFGFGIAKILSLPGGRRELSIAGLPVQRA